MITILTEEHLEKLSTEELKDFYLEARRIVRRELEDCDSFEDDYVKDLKNSIHLAKSILNTRGVNCPSKK